MNHPRLRSIVLALALSVVASNAAAQAPADAAYPAPAIRAWQTGMLRADRLQHASLDMTLSLSCGLASRSAPAALATGIGLGLLKECWDMRRDRFDWLDLFADVAGAGIGASITHAMVR